MSKMNTSNYSTKEELEESLDCSICIQLFEEPKQLHCGHTFCLNCVTKMEVKRSNGDRSITCPNCREITKIPENGLPTNYVLGGLIEKIANFNLKDNLTCFMCQKSVPRMETTVCRTCSDSYLCSLCALKCHKEHEIQFMNSYAMKKRVANAGVHLRCIKEKCKIYADKINETIRNFAAKSISADLEIKAMLSEFDSILDKAKNEDGSLQEKDLYVLLRRANQIQHILDKLAPVNVGMAENMKTFFKSISDGAQIVKRGVGESEPGKDDLDKLKAILDDDSLSNYNWILPSDSNSTDNAVSSSTSTNIFAYRPEKSDSWAGSRRKIRKHRLTLG